MQGDVATLRASGDATLPLWLGANRARIKAFAIRDFLIFHLVKQVWTGPIPHAAFDLCKRERLKITVLEWEFKNRS